MNAPRRPPNTTNSGTALALLALLAAGGGLLGLTALVMPAALGFLAVIFGFFCFGALHYLLWGWWLSSTPSGDDESPANDPDD